MSDNFYPYLNRTACGALEEMRQCFKTYNFAGIGGLIEELQSMVNRMEAALHDKKDIKEWTELRTKLKEEIRQLQKERDALKPKEGE